MARFLMILTYTFGCAGAALGLYFLSTDSERALATIAAVYVVIGLFSFARHVLLWRSDARRLGADDQTPPFFQWETGFANGAFAVAALIPVAFGWGVAAIAVAVLGYAIYLLQAALLNGYRYFTGQGRTPSRLWGSFLGGAALCVIAAVIALTSLSQAGLRP